MRKSEYFKRHTYTPNAFYEVMRRVEDAMSDDIALVNVIPAEADKFQPTATEATAGVTYTIKAQLTNGDKDVHSWYNATHNLTVVVTAANGNVSVNGGAFGVNNADVAADVDFVAGEVEFTVTLGGVWVAGNTVQITVPTGATNVLGHAIRTVAHDVVEVQADPA